MSDLVRKLQEECDRHVIGYPGPRRYVAELLQQAKDEITRLQKELETARDALERLVTTYDGMEDGDGNPCPDVAHAREVYRALKDKEAAG